MTLHARGREWRFPASGPLLMGIVNLSPDSFSGDGIADSATAVSHARALEADGADIIDIGAESARTNRAPISDDEEIERFLGFLQLWDGTAALSINTWRPNVARTVLAHGGDILNDIGGLPTDENARICAVHGVALVIMHTVGEPKVAHRHVRHDDIMGTLHAFFRERCAMAAASGLLSDQIILDPGIGFAKQPDDDLRIFREATALQEHGRPVLMPISRKSVIRESIGATAAIDRDPGTMAAMVEGMRCGVQIFRVHNVGAARITRDVINTLL